jgi:hypothetical protein
MEDIKFEERRSQIRKFMIDVDREKFSPVTDDLDFELGQTFEHYEKEIKFLRKVVKIQNLDFFGYKVFFVKSKVID